MKNQRDRLSLNLNFGAVWLFVLVLASFLAGCSSTSKRVEMAQQTVKEAYEIHKPLEVRTSKNDNRPDWTKMTVFENDGHVYFTGGFMNGSDYSVTIRCANAEALKVAVQSVSQFVRISILVNFSACFSINHSSSPCILASWSISDSKARLPDKSVATPRTDLPDIATLKIATIKMIKSARLTRPRFFCPK